MPKTESRKKSESRKPKVWFGVGELSAADQAKLDEALASYAKEPEAGSSWEEVEARIRAKLRR